MSAYFETDDEDLYDGSGSTSINIDEDQEEGSGDYDEGSGHDSSEEVVHSIRPVSMVEQQRIRHEFYYKHDADILRFDTSCVIRFTEAPEISNAEIR